MSWWHINYRGGIHLPNISLWLDVRQRRDWAFVSHAHSDHVAAHRHAMLSEATLRFMEQRKCRPAKATVLPFRETHRHEGIDFTLFPSGHMVGSAQLLAESQGQRLLYSGDFKLHQNDAAAAIEIPTADVLIMETTFGHQRYKFPPHKQVVAAMSAWCDECLANNITPVLLGYSLGKGQEILAALAAQPYEFFLHPAIYEMTVIAEEMGAVFPRYQRWEAGMGAGGVVLCPPHLIRKLRGDMPPFRSAIVSGWALDPSARYRFGTDKAFCLSDHADYEELLDYVAQVNPQFIYTVHGQASNFANELRRRGYQASALDEDDQLALF